MRRNRRVRPFNEEAESKKLIYISVSVVAMAILAFIITYVTYSNTLNKKTNVGELNKKITEYSPVQNEQSSQASNPIGKNINEVAQEQNEEEMKIAINTTNVEKQATNEITEKKEIEQTNKKINEEVNEVSKKEPEVIPDPTFSKPVEGEILKEFANENLVYSETLKEWVTHNGIDIKAEKTSIVKSVADGTVKSIKNDPRYGITVVIEHVNGYVSVYSNLLTAEFVKEGETVKQGQTIGTIGNTATFEIADESHLHFEMLKDNQYLNPSEYIK